MKTPIIYPALLAAFATLSPCFAQADAAFEKAAVLSAQDLLPAEQLQGVSYRVRDQVLTDGYMAYFTIDTDFGTFEAIGVPQAKQRMAEAEAIRKLVETSKGDLFAKNAAGFDKAKLETAKQLAVDPYSDNARMKEEIEKVTWAFFAGGLPLRIGAAAASAGLAVTATNMIGVPEDAYALTQGELALRDNDSLSAMGLEEADIQMFQRNPSLSTTRRHEIVLALEAMPAASGRGLVIRLADSTTTPQQADFLGQLHRSDFCKTHKSGGTAITFR